MRINPFVYGFLVLVLFFGTIGGAKAAGYWSISGKVTSSGERATATGTNVEEIKGWMTLDEIATAYKVPVAEMLAAFSLPADTPGSTQVKQLESDTFSTTGLRTWLKTRLGQ